MAKKNKKVKKQVGAAAPLGGGAYFLAFIGATVYFWHHAHGFWGFVYAILKGAVWPAILLYRAFMLLRVA